MKIPRCAYYSVLILCYCFITLTTAHGDLGLDSSDFGSKRVDGILVDGKPVSGQPVTGKPINQEGDGTTSSGTSDDDGTSTGEPGTDSPMCRDESGNSALEGGNCENVEQCLIVGSHVNLFTRKYQDQAIDMSVKAPGGFIKVYRVYDEGRWQHEHEYNRIDISKSAVGNIKKATLTYRKGTDGIFRYKSFTIKKQEDQYRWQNKAGDYVLYSPEGSMLETGNRQGVLAKYIYDKEKLLTINDRNNNPVYDFHYDSSGKVTKVSDKHDRSVSYTWQDDKLMQVTDVLGHIIQFSYNSENQLIGKTDEADHKVTISYHPDGAVKSVLTSKGGGHFFSFKHIGSKDHYYAQATTTMGNVQEFWYDSKGETVKIKENQRLVREDIWQNGKRISTDEIGSRTVKTYDKNDNLIKKEFSDGTSISQFYDSKNNLIKTTNELGIETRYNYNEHGQVTRKKAAYKTKDEAVTSSQYDAQGRLISSTLHEATGDATTFYQYDKNDNLIQITDPEGGVIKYEYDFMGNIIKSIDPVGLTTSMAYDAKGNLLSSSTPNGQKITHTYDPSGRRLSSKDQEGSTTSFTYDSQDNLIQVKDALGGVIKTNFDKDNRITKRVDQEGKYQIFFYDGGSKRISKIIDGSGNEIDITYRGYDNCGSCETTFSNKPVRIEFPTFTRQFSYDRRGRVTKKSDIVGTTILSEKYKYDKVGRLISSTDRNGKTTQKEYDNLNRVTTITDPMGGKTLFIYSPHGRLLSLTDAKGQITKFEYDLLGNKTKETRPLGNSLNYLYDQAGRLLQRVDGEGQAISYFYNDTTGYLDGYILKKNENDFKGEHVKFSYDSHGLLSGYDDGTTKAIYTHDILGRRLKTEVDYTTFTSSHSYTYYRNGKKKSYTGPDGLTHTYTYTPINLLRNINIQGVGKVSYLNYKWLKPEKITSPGMVREDTYDHFLRLTKRKTSAAGKTILDLSYEYNVLDNIISRKSGDTLTGYSYDDLQRLVQVDKNNQTQKSFTFDPVGNRLSTNKEPSYTYDANNQLLAVGETSYTYDKNGNTTTIKSPQETSQFEYNFENRLSKVTKNGIEATYYYDPFGRRLSKTVNGKTTWFAYGDEGLIAEYDERGKITVSYGWLPGSTWSTDPILTSKAGKHYFYHNDHLGAPHNLTDTSGRVVWQGVYDVYGEVDVVKEEVDNKLRFPGQYFDKETELYYNWHRFYDPKIGRYISADPIGLNGGINMFAYVGGDPVNSIDFTGLFEWPWERRRRERRERERREDKKNARRVADGIYNNPEVLRQARALRRDSSLIPSDGDFEYVAACYYCCESGETHCIPDKAPAVYSNGRRVYSYEYPNTIERKGEQCNLLINMHVHEDSYHTPSEYDRLPERFFGGPRRPFLVISTKTISITIVVKGRTPGDHDFEYSLPPVLN